MKNKWKSLGLLLIFLLVIILIMKTESELEPFSLFVLALIIGGIFAWIIDAIGDTKFKAKEKDNNQHDNGDI